jgi:hypothetical protein
MDLDSENVVRTTKYKLYWYIGTQHIVEVPVLLLVQYLYSTVIMTCTTDRTLYMYSYRYHVVLVLHVLVLPLSLEEYLYVLLY